jgi:hypothetical protein
MKRRLALLLRRWATRLDPYDAGREWIIDSHSHPCSGWTEPESSSNWITLHKNLG